MRRKGAKTQRRTKDNSPLPLRGFAACPFIQWLGYHDVMRTLLLATVICCSGFQFARAGATADWPRWRGPADNGSTEAAGEFPVKWDANSNGLLWKVKLPGKGCSTPIVWHDRIYVTAPVGREDALLAFDLSSGKALWQTIIDADRPGKSNNGSGCNPSPATDGAGIFVYFKSGTLAAIDVDGTLRWKTNLQDRFGRDTLYWDIGTSPVLTQRDVVIAVMHHGGSYVAAFDKLTGDLHWKVSRDYDTPVEGDHSYATPIVYSEGGGGGGGAEALLVWGGQHLTAHDAATGKVLWSCGGFNPQAHANWVVVASPVIAGEVALVPYGRGAELHGIRLGGSDDVTGSARIWERKDTGSFVPTPAANKGRVYLLHDRGEIECIDPATGKTLWTGKLPRKSASYYASPMVAGGKLYAAREDGVVFVVRVDGPFEVLAQNEMGERIIASPVPIAGGGSRVLIRGEQHLFCAGSH